MPDRSSWGCTTVYLYVFHGSKSRFWRSSGASGFVSIFLATDTELYENTFGTIVELLSYQFASSVRWIKTQDLFFEQYKFKHFIEVGPSPTLVGMATHTLKAKYETKDGSSSVVATSPPPPLVHRRGVRVFRIARAKRNQNILISDVVNNFVSP